VAAKLYLGLAALFLVHGLYFLRVWLRTGKWRHLCLIGTFATLTAIYALKSWGAIGPCELALNPEMVLRSAAVVFSGAALLGYVRDRKRGG
jgi:hypothetical protein